MNACLFYVTTFSFVCKETNYLFPCSDAEIQLLQRVRQCVMMRIVKALKRNYSVLWPTRWDSDCLSMGLGFLFQVQFCFQKDAFWEERTERKFLVSTEFSLPRRLFFLLRFFLP